MDINQKSALRHLPNFLTLSRILVVLPMAVILTSPSKSAGFIATVLFAIASFTDWLDGYLARRMGIITVLGKFLDPIADKLLVMAALIMIIPFERVPAWMVLVILSREIIITGLRGIASSEGIVIAASNLGKYKTIFQIVAILGLLLHYEYYWLFGLKSSLFLVNMHNVGIFYLWIATIITVWSGIDYLVRFFKVLLK